MVKCGSKAKGQVTRDLRLDDYRSRLNIKISEREAVVLFTMWKNCDPNNYIAEDGVLDLVNLNLGSNGRSLSAAKS